MPVLPLRHERPNAHWWRDRLKMKKPDAPAVKREAEEDMLKTLQASLRAFEKYRKTSSGTMTDRIVCGDAHGVAAIAHAHGEECGPRPGSSLAEARRPRRVPLPRPLHRPLAIMRRAAPSPRCNVLDRQSAQERRRCSKRSKNKPRPGPGLQSQGRLRDGCDPIPK
jgi:hypothetical protein